MSSKTTTENRHIPLRIEARYLAIPASWAVVPTPPELIGELRARYPKRPERPDAPDWRYLLVPTVNPTQTFNALDPFLLRSKFLRLDLDNEKQTLAFLNEIGVWNVDAINERLGDEYESRRIDLAVGHRRVIGYASVFAVGDLKMTRERVLHQLTQLRTNRSKLRALFGTVPASENRAFAERTFAANTIPLNFEWKRDPIGVIQAISGHEMLNFTLHMDLVSERNFAGICLKCHVPFTDTRRRNYCSDPCMKAAAQKQLRLRQQQEREAEKAWRKNA